MKRQWMMMAGWAALVALVGAARGQTSRPALPEGHPDLSQTSGGRSAAAPSPGGPGMPKLPQGHPDISEMMRQQGVASTGPATQPAGVGSVAIRVYQGTQGGPSVGGEKVAIRLHLQDGQLLDTLEATLDVAGQAVVKDIPLKLPVLPVLVINHAGVEFLTQGQQMLDGTRPHQQLVATVYESTEMPPAHEIKMRHVMLQPHTDDLHVHEMLMVANPTDRVWLGQADADGQRVTLSLTLPPGVNDVEGVEGFDPTKAKIENGRLVNRLPLMPGTNRYQFAYTVMPKAGQAAWPIAANAPTRQLMVFATMSGCTAEAPGLESRTQEMEDGQTVRVLRGLDLAKDQTVSLTVSNFVARAGGKRSGGGYAPQIIAALGGGALLVIAVVFFFIKSPKGDKTAKTVKARPSGRKA